MPRIASLPSDARYDTVGIGSKQSSSPSCLTGFKRFIERLLHRDKRPRAPRCEAPRSSPLRRSESPLPPSPSTVLRSPLPTTSPASTRRHVMATRLEDLIRSGGGPRLGLSGFAPSIYHRALGGLFTNHWDMAWGSRHRDMARYFPEGPELEEKLEAMSAGAMPPLFVLPRPGARYWDTALPAGEVKKVLSINTNALSWPLQVVSDALEREAGPKGANGGGISRDALRRSLDAIRIVQSMLRAQPDLTLRELLARYPAHVADWRAARRYSDVPHQDWELTHTDNASLPDRQPPSDLPARGGASEGASLAALLRELEAHASLATLRGRTDPHLSAIAIQGHRWLHASDPGSRTAHATRLMSLCQAELDRTAHSVDTLAPEDEALVHRRLRLLSTLMVDVRHREAWAFSLDPVVAPDSPAARNDSPIQKDRPGAGS